MAGPIQPFNPDGKGIRRAVVLACPNCKLEGRYVILDAKMVLDLGPGPHVDSIDTPFYRYCCDFPGCNYIEIHLHLLMRRS